MKRILIRLGLVVLILVGFSGFIGYNLYHTGKVVAQNITSGSPAMIQQSVKWLEFWWWPVHAVSLLFPKTELAALDEMVVGLPKLIGIHGTRHYIVLFQNNMELRPTGGFMGSYAEVWFSEGKLSDVSIQDIYVPDGQIKGYVKEPDPIKTYLFDDNHPGWRLRDANWDPDFPTAVKAINWFFKEGNIQQPVDGYIAIDLYPIVSALQVTGGIPLPDYGITVNADNFYLEAQQHAETAFFPGSTQKGDFLRSVGSGLLNRLTGNSRMITPLAQKILPQLREKQISVSIPDVLGKNWHNLGWDGSLINPAADYLMIDEANVGMTKANCCIDRKLNDQVTLTPTQINHVLQLTYINNNPPVPEPPEQWGGGYKDYLRVIVPQAAELQSVIVDGKAVNNGDITIDTTETKKSFGFLVLTQGKQQSQIKVNYSLPNNISKGKYRLYFQKQPGVEMWPIAIQIKNAEKMSQFNQLLRMDALLQ